MRAVERKNVSPPVFADVSGGSFGSFRGSVGAGGPDLGGSGPGTSPEEGTLTLLGDVVICPAVAARNATEHEVSLEDELALLVVHGLLHLLGMDHEDDAEAERMEALEQELLTRYYRTEVPGP